MLVKTARCGGFVGAIRGNSHHPARVINLLIFWVNCAVYDEVPESNGEEVVMGVVTVTGLVEDLGGGRLLQ